MRSNELRNGKGSRLVVSVALVAATTVLAGCGSRLDDQTIVNALASTLTAGTQAAPGAGAPVDQGTAGVQQPGGTAIAPTTSAAGKPAAAATTTTAAGGASGTAASTKGQIASSAPRVANAAAPAGSTAAAPPTRSGPRSTLVFGNISSYSGVLGAVTSGNKYALAAWVEMQNARGGLDGHPIKLTIGDDRADPATGLTVAKRMVENDHILAFVGNLNVFGFDQYADYAKSKGIPFIGGDGVEPRWYNDPNAFPTFAPTSTGIQAGLGYFVSTGVTRIGMAYCLEVAKLCSYLNDVTMKSPVGKYIVDDSQVSLLAPSYTSQCLRWQAAKVELAYLLMDSAGAARFVQDCATQGFKPKVMILGLDATPELPKFDAMQGSYVPGTTAPPSETQVPAIAEYRAAMAKYAPGVGDGGASGLGWGSGLVLGRAGAHLPDNPTAVDFKANLWKMKNDDLGGFTVPLTFPKDKPAIPSNCVYIWEVKDHKWYAPKGPKAIC